jgi:hypothetical protein
LSVRDILGRANKGLLINPEEGLCEDNRSNIFVVHSMDVSQLHAEHQQFITFVHYDILRRSTVSVVLVKLDLK